MGSETESVEVWVAGGEGECVEEKGEEEGARDRGRAERGRYGRRL